MIYLEKIDPGLSHIEWVEKITQLDEIVGAIQTMEEQGVPDAEIYLFFTRVTTLVPLTLL